MAQKALFISLCLGTSVPLLYTGIPGTIHVTQLPTYHSLSCFKASFPLLSLDLPFQVFALKSSSSEKFPSPSKFKVSVCLLVLTIPQARYLVLTSWQYHSVSPHHITHLKALPSSVVH